jgi:chromatin assembly factor 1 subunit B
MKCTVPEISWHNRDPVLSADVQLACKNETFERLATGGTDSHVVVSIQSVLWDHDVT